jgi:hypothetical protein
MSARAPRHEDGVVYVEFLMAFIPLFVLFLGVAQTALIAAAQLTVQHAATRGARSAAVVLYDDLARYEDVERGGIGGPPVPSSEWSGVLGALGLASEDGGAEPDDAFTLGGPRLAAIRRAVHFPLAALAPEPTQLASWIDEDTLSLRGAIGSAPLLRLLTGLVQYTGITTAVTLPVAPGSNELHQAVVPPEGPAIVRVTHLFHCAVPIVSTLMCRRLAWNLDAAQLDWRTPDDDDSAFDELRHAPGASLHPALAASSARFVVLRAEASMPMHAAAYPYPGEGDDS